MPHSTPDKLVGWYYLTEDLVQIKKVILICFFFVAFLAYGDYLNLGLSSTFYTTVFARVIFLLFSTIILLILKNVKTPQQHDYVIFLWCAVFIFMSLYINISRPVSNINFSYIDTLVILAIFAVFPCNMQIKGILAGILTLGDLGIILIFKAPISDLSLKTIGLSYLLANVLGLFMAHRLQQFRRQQYAAILQEQNIRKELEQVAFIDHLTGALNRRKFFQLGALEFDKCKRYGTSFSIIMLDLDFFKKLNDKFGHAAGDDYLIEFTKIVVENKRISDILGRLGGEEFALLLPETNLECALEMAERMRRLCEAKKIFFYDQLINTTVSIGITTVWNRDRTFQEVLKRADDALYQAKRKGRNQIQLKIKNI